MAGRESRPRGSRRSGYESYRSTSSVSQATFAAGSSRALIPLIFFAAVAVIFLGRLIILQVIQAPEYLARAEEARTVSFELDARRGTIYDRSGNVLATSVEASTIYANPSEVEDVQGTASALAGALGGEAASYEEKLSADETTFAFMKRKASVEEGEAVEALELQGVYLLPDTRREYPYGQIGGQVVGFCGVDGDGLSGLELYYDEVLAGEPGYYEAERGVDGTPIPGGVHEETKAVDGQDIVISLDMELQQYVEDRLRAGVEQLGAANGGSAVVIDGATGEIYAAASLPLFNPADTTTVEERATELRAVTDLFEPGSIFKSVSAMAILEAGTMGPNDELFCPAEIEADGFTITDAHERGDATFTLQQIMDQSSNIGISLATEKTTPAGTSGFLNLYEKILAYNLHTRTGVDYPGEGELGTDILGYLLPFDQWGRITGYNVSFGQGISVTPLQMTRFYSAFVNEGVECTPHFLLSKPQSNETFEYPTVDVIQNKEAIPTMVNMLKSVVSDGTGKLAAIDGFQVAGKTSTAEIYDEENGGYRSGVYNLAFTGFLADSSSQLVCFVGANEVHYDGVVTPIFRDIMANAIDRFKITP